MCLVGMMGRDGIAAATRADMTALMHTMYCTVHASLCCLAVEGMLFRSCSTMRMNTVR